MEHRQNILEVELQVDESVMASRFLEEQEFGNLSTILNQEEEENISYSGLSANYQYHSYFMMYDAQKAIHPSLIGLMFKFVFKKCNLDVTLIRFPVIIPIISTNIEQPSSESDGTSSETTRSPIHMYELVAIGEQRCHAEFVKLFYRFRITLNSVYLGQLTLQKENEFLEAFCQHTEDREMFTKFMFEVFSHE
eukprot:NODE_327_length_9598_cov_1.179914.p5 type:complete len:193 gc:universal NODE_327_length_9598_cov_1.179914:8927-9505(+)